MTIYLRTPEEKANHAAWWEQPDEIFFSAGACHILASVLVASYEDQGFSPFMVQPCDGPRGGHVIAANRTRVIDASGFHRRADFLEEYTREIRAQIPEWEGKLVQLTQDPASWEFCRERGYRHPSQFPHDPLPRAEKFIVALHKRARDDDPDGYKIPWGDFPGGEALVAYFREFDGYERELAIALEIIQITTDRGPNQEVLDHIIARILKCPEGSMLCDMWRQVRWWGQAHGLEVGPDEPFPWH